MNDKFVMCKTQNNQLLYSVTGDERIADYMIKTVNKNTELNIIAPIYKHINGKEGYFYTVDGMMSLKEFLENHEVEVYKVCEILHNIAATVIKAENFMIGSACLLFDANYIFFDNDPSKLSFLLITENSAGNNAESSNEENIQFRELISEIVFGMAEYKDKGEGFLETWVNMMKGAVTPEKVLKACENYEKIIMLKELAYQEEENISKIEENKGDNATEPEKAESKRNNLGYKMPFVSLVLIIICILLPEQAYAFLGMEQIFGLRPGDFFVIIILVINILGFFVLKK